MNYPPPKWADRFLEWFCSSDLLEELQGDLYEIYEKKVREGKIRRARLLFIWLVLRSFRPSVISKKWFNNSLFTMTRNNIKIAFRVLWREKFNSTLNIIGLAIGIACFVLMGSYVKQEFSFDRMHAKKDRIYRVWLKEDYGDNKIFFNSVTPLRFESLLKEHFSEFDQVVQLGNQSWLVGEGEQRNNEQVYIISPTFFNVFDFRIKKGDAKNPLPTENDIILSETYSTKYFGNEEPLGKQLSIQVGDEVRQFTVSAIFEDMVRESSIQFDMAVSNKNNISIFGQGAMNAWFSVSQETYVLLGEKSSLSTVEEQLPEVVMSYLNGKVKAGVYNIGFQPLTDIHLNPDVPVGFAPVGNRDYVYMLGWICLLVLTVACINYTTLTVGQSIRRSREVGVRKVMGAFRGSLVWQYLSESILIATISLLIGIGLALVALPSFNALTGANVVLTFEFWQIFAAVGLILIIGVLSGIYPAFILARLKAVAVLKGNSGPRGNHLIRKGMVVLQFVITVFLISSTLIIRKQLNYMQTMDLGFNYEAAVAVPLYPDPSAGRLSEMIGTAKEKGEILKEKLSQYPTIRNIGMGSHVFGNQGWGNFFFTDDSETFRGFRILYTDAHYLSTFDIKIKAGRDFEPGSGLDERQSIILNQAAVDYFGFDDPIGKKLPGRGFGDHVIIGVTENFNYSSLHMAVEPLVISQNVQAILQGVSDVDFGDSPIPKLVFKYTGSSLLEVKDILKKEWDATFPGEELNFSFVDENMRFQYASEERLNKLVVISSILSLIIASLGLLGLAVLVTNSREREIGIRKVIGASVSTIFAMLVKSFAVQLLIGIVLSIPVTYLLMVNWLQDFAFKTNIGVGVFIVSGLSSMIIALLVISFHTLKAAMTNPANSIRSE